MSNHLKLKKKKKKGKNANITTRKSLALILPGGTRFLLITCLAPFKAGTVVLISAAPRLYPSPVTGFPSAKN